jgi:plastocyanin
MQVPVQVVDEGDFEEWAAAQAKPAEPTPGASPAAAVQIAAKNAFFDKDSLEAPAGQPFAIEFDNLDGGVQHNVAIYEDDSAQDQLFVGEIFPGPEKRIYQVPALDADEYFFRCDVHPATMTGTLTVK